MAANERRRRQPRPRATANNSGGSTGGMDWYRRGGSSA